MMTATPTDTGPRVLPDRTRPIPRPQAGGPSEKLATLPLSNRSFRSTDDPAAVLTRRSADPPAHVVAGQLLAGQVDAAPRRPAASAMNSRASRRPPAGPR